MNKTKFDPALLLRIQVLEAERRYKSAETWQHAGDWPYKLFSVLFIISSSVILLLNLFYILGTGMEISRLNEDASGVTNAGQLLATHRNHVVIASVLSAMIIAALVLFIFKNFLIPVILAVISGISGNIFFYTLLKSNYENNTSEITEINEYVSKYVLRHLVPAIVFVVGITIVFLIALRDKRTLKREYNKATQRIYDVHRKRLEDSGEEYRMMSPEEWTELVTQYVSGDLGGKRKRSKKEKARKEKVKPESESEDSAE